jgi:cytoskeletal protein RodZ
MKEKNQNVKSAFGRYLQRKRLAERISLVEVSKKTRIRTQTLLAIEKVEHEKLPAETYVKGLLRSFARAVGADGEHAVRRYEQSRREMRAAAQFEAGLGKSGAGSWVKLIYTFGLLLAIVVASIYLMRWIDGSRGTEPALPYREDKAASGPPVPEHRSTTTGKPSVSEKNNPSGIQVQTAGHPVGGVHGNTEPGKEKKQLDSVNTTQPAGATGYLLSIHVVVDTWLKVIADDQEAVKYQLKKGDRLDLTAARRFNILIGNARGVRLFVNDRPLPVSGKSGQIVNIDIP